MGRASVADIRKGLVVAEAFKNAGIAFVPMPILSDEDKAELAVECERRLAELEKEC
jgi:hypothetical protein